MAPQWRQLAVFPPHGGMPHVRSADRPREIDLDVCLQGVEDSNLGWVGWRDGGIVQLIRGPLPFISGVKLDLVIGCGEMSFDLPEIRYLDGGQRLPQRDEPLDVGLEERSLHPGARTDRCARKCCRA